MVISKSVSRYSIDKAHKYRWIETSYEKILFAGSSDDGDYDDEAIAYVIAWMRG